MTSGFFKSEQKIAPPIRNLLDINRALSRCSTPDTIQKAAIVLKLLLNHHFDGESDSRADEQNIFIMLRSIFMNTAEVSALMPQSVATLGTELVESDFERRLDNIKSQITLVLSTPEQALATKILESIRSLFKNFESINAFAKNHPDELYFLDEAEQKIGASERGELPFHLKNYGIDDELRNTLLRIVREYIAAYDLSKSVGRVKEFFEKMNIGNCLDGRVRDVATWVAQFSGLETFNALMAKYISEYQAYRSIIDGVTDVQQDIVEIEPVLEFIMRYHKGEIYKVEGSAKRITDSIVRNFLHEIMGYEEKKKTCVVQ